jgi:hypothetical protein
LLMSTPGLTNKNRPHAMIQRDIGCGTRTIRVFRRKSSGGVQWFTGFRPSRYFL